MNSLKAKVTLLLMAALTAMSVLSMAAAYSVATHQPSGGVPFFRYVQEVRPGAPAARPVTAQAEPDEQPSVGAVISVYVALIVAGAAAVSIVVANMVTRPLLIFERAAAAIGPDGSIPHIPEEGLGEVRAAAEVLNRMSDHLSAAMESRMRLVAAAGHDLRTPMTRMRLRAEFIDDEAERALWLRDLAELEGIADSAIRLVREEVEMAGAEPVRVDEMVREIADDLREIGLDVTVDGSVPASARAGDLAMRRALRNLMQNAATHGGGARVRIFPLAGTVRVVIDDDGPGIPEAVLERAFEPFFRADPARQQKVPGAGLGLAIAKEIVTRHGGEVALRNRPGGGLTQEVRLPHA